MRGAVKLYALVTTPHGKGEEAREDRYGRRKNRQQQQCLDEVGPLVRAMGITLAAKVSRARSHTHAPPLTLRSATSAEPASVVMVSKPSSNENEKVSEGTMGVAFSGS